MDVSKDKATSSRVISHTNLKNSESTKIVEQTDKEKKRNKKRGKASIDESIVTSVESETEEKDDKKKSKKKMAKECPKNHDESLRSSYELSPLLDPNPTVSKGQLHTDLKTESTEKEKKRTKKWGRKMSDDESIDTLTRVNVSAESETEEKDDKKKSKKKMAKECTKNHEESLRSSHELSPLLDPNPTVSKGQLHTELTEKEKKRTKKWGRKISDDESTDTLTTFKNVSVESETEEKDNKKKSKRKVAKECLKTIEEIVSTCPIENFPLQEFCGIRYRLVKTEMFEEYLKAMSMNLVTRRMALKFVPTLLVLSHDGTNYSLLSSSLFLHLEVKFLLGRSFRMTTPDGRDCSVVFTFEEPNVLVEIQTGTEVHTITRIFRLNSVHMSLALNNVVCKMTFLPCTTVPEQLKTIHSTGPRPTIYDYSQC